MAEERKNNDLIEAWAARIAMLQHEFGLGDLDPAREAVLQRRVEDLLDAFLDQATDRGREQGLGI